jgi:oligopeptide/dipeptide ABC transporter ATP-binding protein
MAAPLLEVENLHVDFTTRHGVVHGVRGLSLEVARGRTLGIVGESGSGKSVTAQAVMGLVNVPGEITAGDIRWKGRTLLGEEGRRYARRVRGREMAIIFQDPMTSLNPVVTIGNQIAEAARVNLGMGRPAARRRAAEVLSRVGIPRATERLEDYPHQFSGGMRQRVMIAMAISSEPRLLIADEPTTALDVTIQAQIVDLVRQLQQEMGMAIMWITHDLGVIARLARRVNVMYAGSIVETAPIRALFRQPAHPYTLGLLQSVPRPDLPKDVELAYIDGAPPDMIRLPPGCPFYPRCAFARDRCSTEKPPLLPVENDHAAACWYSDEVRAASDTRRVASQGA